VERESVAGLDDGGVEPGLDLALRGVGRSEGAGAEDTAGGGDPAGETEDVAA